ncbi:U-box domain-containing protein 33-like [Telopea speciosissima]|uniref:U-box domain-containing protein 33-like n=1 Tax=Telopea speciosissima TaxID=54955 RepID=UPI001CC78376|nr:U-box domain-containing protein 33-like [Telopea speciosissima]
MESGDEDNTEGSSHVEEDKIFVALGNVMEESTWTLLWALKNFRRKNFYILHVHQPAQEICVMGAKFKADGLDRHQVRAYREKEKKEMNDLLNEYLDICLHAGVYAEPICIEMENVERGIVELIAQHGITKLVMRAASDRHYSEKMEKLESKKAIFVYNEAPVSCHIWFVCKGHLILKREGISEETAIKAPSVLDSPMRIIHQLDQPRNIQLPKSFSHGAGGSSWPRSPVQNQIQRATSTISDTTKVPAKLTNPVQDLFRRAFSSRKRNTESSTGREQKASSSRGEALGIQKPIRFSSQSSDCSSRLSIGSSESILGSETTDNEKSSSTIELLLVEVQVDVEVTFLE